MANEATTLGDELKVIRYWYETQCPASSVEYVGKLLRAFEQACGLLERAQQDAGWYDAENFLAQVRGSSGQTPAGDVQP